jgi:hypothetical protein
MRRDGAYVAAHPQTAARFAEGEGTASVVVALLAGTTLLADDLAEEEEDVDATAYAYDGQIVNAVCVHRVDLLLPLCACAFS